MEIIKKLLLSMTAVCLLLAVLPAISDDKPVLYQSLTAEQLADALGWKNTGENRCGGYYLEPAISSETNQAHPDAVEIISNQFLYSFNGTSASQGKITIRRYGQEIIANKAYLYRNPQTGKLNSGSIDLIGNVELREPNTLVLADRGQFNFQTKAPSLLDAVYRTAVYGETTKANAAIPATPEILKHEHKIFQLSAWGQASTFNQERPRVFTLNNASYSTCPPARAAWKVNASHIELNKETGRGTARHARLLIHGVPVFYAPYINFPIDSRRQTGFLWPKFGNSSKLGSFVNTPYYWNMAPNYDMIITPALSNRRGVLITDLFRYLTPDSVGHLQATLVPYDYTFADFQQSASTNTTYTSSTDTYTQAELRRLLSAGTARGALTWKNNSQFNEHWFSTIDYNYVSDDYYPRDLVTNLSEVTENQLLQKADLTYKGENWNFTSRFQSYQTLHPINAVAGTVTENQYSRFPQLVLNGDYPNNPYGFEYSISNELTRFDFRNTPGNYSKQPMGVRTNVQPVISRPFNTPYFMIEPELQFPMTKYELGHVVNGASKTLGRTLPIFDLNTGMYFDRSLSLFGDAFTQTLEPRAYYTYIPFRNQSQLPVFDTSLNQLSYDQLFLYNRFSGIDRIGDTNQIALGLVTRFINDKNGDEKVRAGLGQIYYFQNRRVTLCGTTNCSDVFNDPNANKRNRSPITGLLKYHMNALWNLESNTIWDPLASQQKLINQTVTLHYQTDPKHIINFGYTFAKDGDRKYPDMIDSSSNNLSQTDVSAAWSVTRDWSGVARWTQNLNRHNFQNLLFGVQYDSCCWAVRLVAGREFVGVNPNNNNLQYNSLFFVQFALKGLGNLGSGDPTPLLASSVSGYQTQFGQDY